MDKEEKIVQWLETSPRRGVGKNAADAMQLVKRINDKRWSRQVSRIYNLLTLLLLLVVMQNAVAWIPEPEYSHYCSSQATRTPEGDSQILHQMLVS